MSSTNRGASPWSVADDEPPLRQTTSAPIATSTTTSAPTAGHFDREDLAGAECSSAAIDGSSDMHRLNHLATAARNRAAVFCEANTPL